MVRYNDIISLFRLDNIRGEDVTYVFDKYIRTDNNPASTSMGKSSKRFYSIMHGCSV
jgi:hypothetical protein